MGSTLAASGAAVGEVTRATEEEHRKEVWPQRLAHVEDDEVLTVNCKQVNCYSNQSATGSTLVSLYTAYHSLCDDVVDEFVAGGKSTYSKKDRHRCRHTHTQREKRQTEESISQSINQIICFCVQHGSVVKRIR